MVPKYIEARGIRIRVTVEKIVVEATEPPPNRPYQIEVDYEGQRQTHGAWNPAGPAFTIVPPLGRTGMDCTRCDVRVRDGLALVCEWVGGSKFIIQQCGWKPCVACSDSKLRPGMMWVGHNSLGVDRWITCPSCNGIAREPLYKYIDPATGLEIDYEQQAGRLLVV